MDNETLIFKTLLLESILYLGNITHQTFLKAGSIPQHNWFYFCTCVFVILFSCEYMNNPGAMYRAISPKRLSWFWCQESWHRNHIRIYILNSYSCLFHGQINSSISQGTFSFVLPSPLHFKLSDLNKHKYPRGCWFTNKE